MVANNRNAKKTALLLILLSALFVITWGILSGHTARAAAEKGINVPAPVPTQPTHVPTATPPGGHYTVTPTTGVPHPLPTAIPTICPMNFSDVTQGDWFYPYVNGLFCRGAISGYSDGTFRPNNNTTRGQLSKIIVLAEAWPITTAGGPHFSDVPATNPFYAYIETAYSHGAISGYSDGTFHWGNNITRGQLSKIIVLSQGWATNTAGGPHFTDVPDGSAFYAYVETAYNKGVVSGYSDGTFHWGSNATRAQLAKIVQSALLAH